MQVGNGKRRRWRGQTFRFGSIAPVCGNCRVRPKRPRRGLMQKIYPAMAVFVLETGGHHTAQPWTHSPAARGQITRPSGSRLAIWLRAAMPGLQPGGIRTDLPEGTSATRCCRRMNPRLVSVRWRGVCESRQEGQSTGVAQVHSAPEPGEEGERWPPAIRADVRATPHWRAGQGEDAGTSRQVSDYSFRANSGRFVAQI